MRTMYDGIDSDAEVIPTDTQLVAGYIDGDYVWSAADWARFPRAVHVEIAVKSTTDAGHVLDVENGDATPEESVNWVLTRRHSGADPTIYCSQSEWPTVRAAFASHDVTPPHWWIASYNGNPAIPAGAIAHQYDSFPRWDISSVADYWPGVDKAPATTTPAPAPDTEEDEMQQIEPVSQHPGEYAYGVPAGKTQVALNADGYGDPPARVRLVIWNGNLDDVHDGIEVGGTGPKRVVITLPTGSTGITVRREDANGYPIGVALS